MLTEKQLEDIKSLQKTCEEHENILLKLNWEMLKNRDHHVKQDFFYYEEDVLKGFTAIYGFGNKAEICGMVHPGSRRNRIFFNLLQQAIGEVKNQGYRQILLNAPGNSQSAKGFLSKTEAVFVFSEHQMKWEGGPLNPDTDLVLRRPEAADFPFEVQIDVDCFGFSPKDAEEYNRRLKMENEQQSYIIEYKEEPAGKVRVSEENGEAWIYGFAISPEHQKRGIGRKTLISILSKETEKGNPVFLEVEAKNTGALKLYESCGFKAYYAQDYYLI
ncbi:GNAT family N-acetyltransferase [Metabacillus sp. 84]|uniref:GNAT family N-acetyltransferase n=1 Tax=Metabacillus sp. 84 TaxID=3404705 RepID=UPI003CF4E1FB